jgi:hypothetical protein
MRRFLFQTILDGIRKRRPRVKHLFADDAYDCQTAPNTDLHLECALAGGQNQAAALTICWAC